MSENKHTPEPLTYMELPTADGEFMVLGGVGQEYGLVASCVKLEDARRIVACVNACTGIPTEKLEEVLSLGQTLIYRFSEFKTLTDSLKSDATIAEKQRDELLAALEKAEGAIRELAEECDGDYELADELAAAIASVKASCGAQAETAKNEGGAA